MKTLFLTFKKSMYNPEFYRAAAEANTGDVLRSYTKITFVYALFATVMFSVLLVPQGVRFIRDIAPVLVTEHYPADLTVHLEKGEATASVVQPYIIAGNNATREVLKENGLENMLVIDTTHDFSSKAFDDYKTFALLTKSQVITRNNEGNTTIQNLRGIPDMVIDQAGLLSLIKKIHAALIYIVPVGIVMTLIILFFGYIAYLVPLFLFALIPFFLAKVRKVPLTYSGAYKISMYAVLPGLALKTILNIGGIFYLPAYFSLLVFMLVIVINMREVEQPTLFN